jgi:hypothetical protein
MASAALPIFELERSVRVEANRAKAETDCVIQCSRERNENLRLIGRLISKIFSTKWRLANMAKRQQEFIDALVKLDFTTMSQADLKGMASALNEEVQLQREILEAISELGAEIRIWWSASIRKLTEQVEHLDSIAESLHLAADPEGLALLSLAAEQVASR